MNKLFIDRVVRLVTLLVENNMKKPVTVSANESLLGVKSEDLPRLELKENGEVEIKKEVNENMQKLPSRDFVRYMIGVIRPGNISDTSTDPTFNKFSRILNMNSFEHQFGLVGIDKSMFDKTDNESVINKLKEVLGAKPEDELGFFAITIKPESFIFNQKCVDVISAYSEEVDMTVDISEYEDTCIHLREPFSGHSDKDEAEVILCMTEPQAVHLLNNITDFENIYEELSSDLIIYDKYFFPRKVIVAGSRLKVTPSSERYQFVKSLIYSTLDAEKLNPEKDFIISGTCEGVDLIGEAYAKERGIKVIRKPANWVKFGKAAGYKRNHEMGVISSEAFIFWDGVSKGSMNMAEIMMKLKKKYQVIDIDIKNTKKEDTYI